MITGYFYSDTILRGKEKGQIIKVLKLFVIGNLIVIAYNLLIVLASGEEIVPWLKSCFTLDSLLRFLLFNENVL